MAPTERYHTSVMALNPMKSPSFFILEESSVNARAAMEYNFQAMVYGDLTDDTMGYIHDMACFLLALWLCIRCPEHMVAFPWAPCITS